MLSDPALGSSPSLVASAPAAVASKKKSRRSRGSRNPGPQESVDAAVAAGLCGPPHYAFDGMSLDGEAAAELVGSCNDQGAHATCEDVPQPGKRARGSRKDLAGELSELNGGALPLHTEANVACAAADLHAQLFPMPLQHSTPGHASIAAVAQGSFIGEERMQAAEPASTIPAYACVRPGSENLSTAELPLAERVVQAQPWAGHKQFGMPYLFYANEGMQASQAHQDTFPMGPMLLRFTGRHWHAAPCVASTASTTTSASRPSSARSTNSSAGGSSQRSHSRRHQQQLHGSGRYSSGALTRSSSTSSLPAAEAAAMRMAATQALAGTPPRPTHQPTMYYHSRSSSQHQLPHFSPQQPHPSPPQQQQQQQQAPSTPSRRSAEFSPQLHMRSLSAPTSPLSERLLSRTGMPAAAPAPLPPVPDRPDDAPDLERFLSACTPQLPRPACLDAMADLTMADVWRCYEHPSLFGLECTTLGGPRGPSTSHFVPYLSAVHLFEAASEEEAAGTAEAEAEAGAEASPDQPAQAAASAPLSCDAAGAAPKAAAPGDEDADSLLAYPLGLDTWPACMRRLFSWSAAEHVGDRVPLHQRVTDVSGGAAAQHPLAASLLRMLHPYSWFAVAWYPLYRIPEAPLTARFLTFHSLAPLWEAATAAHALREQHYGAADNAATRPSYKAMLAAGAAAAAAAAAAPAAAPAAGPRRAFDAATPTGVCSFPGSPLAASDVGTRSTTASAGRSAPQSLGGTSAPATASDCASVSASHGSSLSPTPDGSDDGEERVGSALVLAAPTAMPATSPALELPAVGLCWHTAGGGAQARGENWTDTLVHVAVPPPGPGGLRWRCGDAVPGARGARVAGVYNGSAVVRKDYPVAKGGPMSWEIQLEELEEGARRLALGQGLFSLGGGADAHPAPATCCCPDYSFFASRRRR